MLAPARDLPHQPQIKPDARGAETPLKPQHASRTPATLAMKTQRCPERVGTGGVAVEDHGVQREVRQRLPHITIDGDHD
eukprot:939080-Rhodomonas_salina.2